MKNKIDGFFKDKLEDHAFTPSEETWTKVEANLSKQNKAGVWRIAAAILITGALVSIIIWSQRDKNNNEQILAAKGLSKDNSTKEKSVAQISPIETKDEAKSIQKKSSTRLSQSGSSPRSVSPQTENNTDQKNGEETEMSPVKTQTTIVETTVAASENKQEEKTNTKATSPAIIASTKRKPIKLEFTLENFSTEQPVAMANEGKNSRVKKVWELALEVKNGNGPVREMKNELFALSFKKNKNQ